jgi:hypothetical protein
MKWFAIVGTFLFLCVAVAQSINADMLMRDFEVSTEIILPNSSIKLNNQDAIEFNCFIKEIELKLNCVKTNQESTQILIEVIDELENYGLSHKINLDRPFLQRWCKFLPNNYSNIMCVVYANIDNLNMGVDVNVFTILNLPMNPLIYFIPRIIYYLGLYSQIKPLRLMNCIFLSNLDDDDFTVRTIGLKGDKKTLVEYQQAYIIYGFSGIVIKTNYTYNGFWVEGDVIYFGTALFTNCLAI